MPVYDLFSRRKKQREKAGKVEVYQYEDLPQPFRVQVAHIWRETIGKYGVDQLGLGIEPPSNQYWNLINNAMCREKGVFTLSSGATPIEHCVNYLLRAPTEDALDIIEISFRVIDTRVRNLPDCSKDSCGVTQSPDDAIEELNRRFLQNGIGYQYVSMEIVRVDSQFLHSEVVKPALVLLRKPGFEGPEQEFRKAFEHYRRGNNKEAIAEALKALESTLRTICTVRRWIHDENATARKLLEAVFGNGLIPSHLESHFGALRTALESGLPTLRNKTSGHGQGPEPRDIPRYYAAYALHLAAADIVFLVEAHREGNRGG